MSLSAGKYWNLKNMADDSGRFCMLAVDQRPPIKNLCAERRGESTPRFSDIQAVKRQLITELSQHATAVLADPTYSLCDAMQILSPQHGLIVTLEDSLFESIPGGRVSGSIDNWSVSKIKRVGGNAVKVLIWYRPDQSQSTRQKQYDYAKQIGEACEKHDIPFLLELLVYPLEGEKNQTMDYVEQVGKQADHVIQSVVDFSGPEFGVDVFKLESPLPAAAVPDPTTESKLVEECSAYYKALAEASGRPWMMLSAGASKADFKNVLHFAYEAGASGFLAGRSIWWDDFQAFPDMDAMRTGLATNATQYMQELNSITVKSATPWHEHALYKGDAGPSGHDIENFPERYSD